MAFSVTLKWGNDRQQLTLPAPIPLYMLEKNPILWWWLRCGHTRRRGENQYQPIRSNAERRDCRADAGGGRGLVTVVAVTLVISGVAWLGVWWGETVNTGLHQQPLHLKTRKNSYGKCLLVTLGLSNYFFLHNQLETNTKDKVIFEPNIWIWDLSFSSEMLCEK